MSKPIVDRAADNIRILSAAMVEKSNSGHPGGAMGGADYINILFFEFLDFDPDDLAWPFRDRFSSIRAICRRCCIPFFTCADNFQPMT